MMTMKKLRTRQHIIEDLGLNHIERQILLSGNVLRRFNENDYGYDAMIDTFNERGEAENLSFKIQLKSTDNIHLSLLKEGFSIDLSKRDLELWLLDSTKLLVVLYDAQEELAYFVDLQAYFLENVAVLKTIKKYFRINIPLTNRFVPQAIKQLVHFKN